MLKQQIMVAFTAAIVLSLGSAHLALAQSIAQNPPNVDFWQPIAHFQSNAPVTVTLNNQTKGTIEYGLSTGETKRLPAGGSITIGAVPLPTNVYVYPTESPTNQFSKTDFKFDVQSSENVVTVNVQSAQSGSSRDSTLTLQEAGNIYVY